MTVIEFFDKTSIENMLSAMLCRPERVIYIGYNRKQMERVLPIYREVLDGRGLAPELLVQAVNRNDLHAAVDKLTAIALTYDDCVFNLDGGEDLYLVALGMVAAAHPDRVKLHRFNIRNNNMVDCDADGCNQLVEPIALTIRENVRIYGGVVVDEDQRSEGTYPWRFTEDFCQDLHAMWEISCRYAKSWNAQINTLGWIDQVCPQEDPRTLQSHRESVQQVMSRKGDWYTVVPGILQALEREGLISWLSLENNEIEFVFKNEQVKRCLMKAGQLLELMVALAAREARDEEGLPVYQDVQCGVCMDWDGQVAPDGETDVNNEVDVMMMKGAVPVFISCKNGSLEVEELYKLAQVAQRFGGKYARPVLIATQLDKMGAKGEYLRSRAGDMAIRVVDDFDEMTFEQMKELLKGIWRNP